MSTPATSSSVGAADDLLLKVTPPRAPRHLVARARLLIGDELVRDRPIVLVQAPAGFGKTSLLAQWRREHLAQGAVVAWLSAQAQDDPERLARALALAVRTGSGRPTFGHTLLEATPPEGPEAITVWLAEVAQTALRVVLIVDEAERLPSPSRDALGYLLRNLPPNLRAVVAARADCKLGVDDLIAYGDCTLVGPAQLRFTLEETLELVRSRFGQRIDLDAAARLHELTEGWPLGLQLALSIVASGSDPRAGLSAIAAHGERLRGQFVALLLANLDPADVDFLTRIAIVDHLHPDLCRALTQVDDAAARLERMVQDTPVFVATEGSDWLRLHALARDELRARCALLPEAEQAALHARVSQWLAAHGLVESAARHALAAGQREAAYDLAESSLYDSVLAHGQLGTMLEWIGLMPRGELERRPRLLLSAAWTLAVSERHDDAERLVTQLLAQPRVDDGLRCECALILSGAAVYADDPDQFAALHDPWAQSPPLRGVLLQVHANRSAFRALLDGEPALARLRQQQAPREDFGASLGYISRWGELIVGLTYLWEGQVLLAADLLRPTLARAEAELGRRSAFATMLAALLAAALWEGDQGAEAAALLANRLDVLERSGLPDAVLLGYRTMARIAAADGAEHRALELLAALHAIGVARRLPRLRVGSLSDQARLHARRFRVETCRDLCAQIDAVLAEPACPGGPLWRRSVDVLREVARSHAAIAAQDWRGAIEPLQRADQLAQQLKYGRLHIELLGLRAFVLDRLGERALDLLREAADLARVHGLRRVFADAHPALADWVRQALGDGDRGIAGLPGALAAPIRAPQPPTSKLRSTPSMALTPKEREVLELLARNLSNKEIGLAMQVGEETIKWHMKNLFAKLDAGTRKQVVSRARILGLLETE